MSYSQFKSIEDVAKKFDIEVRETSFTNQLNIEILKHSFARLQVKLADSVYLINENAICENIITPILDLIVENYQLLRIWSHISFNIDKKKGLVGEPDYLIAPKTKYGGMSTPPLCIMEAKKEKFDEGWGQTLAEMVATSIQGSLVCYGIVTTGKIWEFGKLENKIFTKDPNQISATSELQTVFNILNWLFKKINIMYD